MSNISLEKIGDFPDGQSVSIRKENYTIGVKNVYFLEKPALVRNYSERPIFIALTMDFDNVKIQQYVVFTYRLS